MDDISGVILLRPTTSPTVYKQQIGRARAAGKSGTPLIFDVVNNFDSLVSVSWMQEEIQNVVSFHQECGLEHREVDEYFRVVDEVRECRVLLGELEKSLSATWDVNYDAAKAYYYQQGHLNVPAAYRTENGIQLGTWISRQRMLYRTSAAGKGLSDLQIQMLEGLGMEWDLHRKAFETGLCAAERYYKVAGNLNVPARYVDDTGYPLYQWMCDVRKKKNKLQERDKAKLDAMQFAWEKNARNIQRD